MRGDEAEHAQGQLAKGTAIMHRLDAAHRFVVGGVVFVDRENQDRARLLVDREDSAPHVATNRECGGARLFQPALLLWVDLRIAFKLFDQFAE